VKKETGLQQLEATRDKLLKSLNLFDLAAAADAPAYLKSLNMAFVGTLLSGADMPFGMDGLNPEASQICRECVKQSGKMARSCLQSDIELLQIINKTGEDQIHEAPFDMIEGAFPVRLQGHIVHCLWSGKLRTKAFSDAEIGQMIEATGLSKKELEQLVLEIPVLTRKQVEQTMTICRRLRTGIEQALNGHVRANELTRQLMQSERTQSLGTLSGGVAHHFNNLLSIILGYSSMVLNRGKLATEAEEALHKISEAAQRGRRLTEEVLAFLGSDMEEEALCRIHEMLSNSLSLLESQVSGGVKVESQLNAKHDAVMAPPGSIRQIVFNLLTNAVDTLSAGGVLTVKTSNVNMKNEEGKEQEFFCLEVSDNSMVVKPGRTPTASDVLPHETAELSRHGLKLSSLYGMVGQLDGVVMMSTEPGTISRVQVFLPVAVDKKLAKEDEMRARSHLAPSHIWVVDDDPIFCAMCRQLLLDEGHSVEQMTSGRDLHERWLSQAKKPDLIVLDFSMPEFNGLQLCEWLKNKGSQVPVILVSGFAPSQPDIRKALKMKKTAFLQKPFTSRELTDTITMVLGETLIGE